MSPDNAHPIRHTTALPATTRNHRQRHSVTTSTAQAPTTMTPGRPTGTGMLAPGTMAAQWATLSTHHTSGPVKRISSCAAAGQHTPTVAAAVPSTVIGTITGAAARLATAATTLTRPEIPATKGAVTT